MKIPDELYKQMKCGLEAVFKDDPQELRVELFRLEMIRNLGEPQPSLLRRLLTRITKVP